MKNIRTHYLGSLTENNIDEKVVVMGWVKKHRNLGELVFMDVKDIKGIAQVVVYNDNEFFELSKNIKRESVIEVVGVVKKRSDVNDKIKTGQIEIIVKELNIINESQPTPIEITDNLEASEETRLNYRYLDLRRDVIQQNFITRHRITNIVRNYLDKLDFIDVETPILTASTPEGARDYLVPSRVNKHEFFALPQSPQIYKNLLMIAGFERYYQIAKCFRDEDLRADRQPEFTQIDMEMSFLTEEQIRDICEDMMKEIMKEVKGISFDGKFEVMDYEVAMNLYGCDKPDLRFDLKICDVTSVFENSEFSVFKNAELVRCLNVKKAANRYSRKDIDKLEALAKKHHAKGMAWLKFNDGEFTGPIVKFLSQDELSHLKNKVCVEENDLILFAADEFDVVCSSLAALRNELGILENLIDEEEFKFVWIINWPMFEYDKDLDRLFAMHHPFTFPKGGSFAQNPMDTVASAYDLVLNGYELGGGSIRINNSVLLNQMFELIKMEQHEIDEKFGFLIDAYKYGAPYHGGIAFGLDRLAMLLTGSDSIRDVIAFPKNNQARELMINSPSLVSQEQLDELFIGLVDSNE